MVIILRCSVLVALLSVFTKGPVTRVSSFTTTAKPPISTATASTINTQQIVVVPPNDSFRETSSNGGEVSIASFNLLAPFYNSLGLPQNTTDYDRVKFLEKDRLERVPRSIQIAKQTNADILCLQEVEGGGLSITTRTDGDEEKEIFTIRDEIRGWLAEKTETDGKGYDSVVWSQLNPNNKRGDMVGLCVAWRSQKHSLVEWEGYKRGIVCQFQEKNVGSPSSFAVANLHLPARPSNILGRLTTMSKTIQKLTKLDTNRDNLSYSASSSLLPKRKSLDGLIIVTGDFNSDQNSVAATLLSRGHTNYGKLSDRNYKAKITKSSASNMSHRYKFIDVYDKDVGGDYSGKDKNNSNNDPRLNYKKSIREMYAPVTVSLKGRGPGIMDHVFYATASSVSRNRVDKYLNSLKQVQEKKISGSEDETIELPSTAFLHDHMSSGKRRLRRKKARTRGGNSSSSGAVRAINHDPKIYVESVLATIDCVKNGNDSKQEDERLRIIYQGLPNLEKGFPSDHLPVGALLSTLTPTTFINNAEYSKSFTPPTSPVTATNYQRDIRPTYTTGGRGVNSIVQRRRKNSQKSFGLRRRHNLVLSAITEWIIERGASSIVRDKPLYKNELLLRIMGGTTNLQQCITRKSRAPDLMCILPADDDGNSIGGSRSPAEADSILIVVEVAVVSNPNKVREQKISKYKDLITAVTEHGTTNVCHFSAIIVKDDGTIPTETRHEIELLAKLNKTRMHTIQAEVEQFCAHLHSLVS